MIHKDDGLTGDRRREWAERELLSLARQSTVAETASRRVVTLLGATGSGKTTIATLLARSFPTYVERATANPELHKLLAGEASFDASHSQKWFTESVAQFIQSSQTDPLIILDQDPVAISLVYSKLFLASGHMTSDEYVKLLRLSIRIERELTRQDRRRSVVFLFADPQTLRARTVRRSMESDVGVPWYEDVHRRFEELSRVLAPEASIDTRNVTAEQARMRVQEAIRYV